MPSTDQLDQSRLLRASSVYVEYALLTGKWQPGAIEVEINERGVKDSAEASTDWEKTGRMSTYRNGGVPHPSTIRRDAKRFEHSNLIHWHFHPIAQILCRPEISHEEVVSILRAIPEPSVRSSIFEEDISSLLGTRLIQFRVDAMDSIEALERTPSHWALLALIGRIKLLQLELRPRLHARYASAVLRNLLVTVPRSPHLFSSCTVLVGAVFDFLGRSPFEELSILDWSDPCFSREGNIASLLGAHPNATVDGINLPPLTLVESFDRIYQACEFTPNGRS